MHFDSPLRVAQGSLVAAITLGLAGVVPAEENRLAGHYGFGAIEPVILTERSSDLRAADLDGDGRIDLLLADNSNNRLDLLRQRDPEKADQETSVSRGVNEFSPSSLFEHVKLPVDREVISLATGDFNADGHADIAYVGSPDRLVMHLAKPEANTPVERFSDSLTIRLPDLPAAGLILATGDFDNDGRDESCVIGKQKTFVIGVDEKGGLESPTELLNTADDLGLAQAADLNGDELIDLCYTASDGDEKFLCFRLQNLDGELGPEIRYDVQEPRSVTLADLDQTGGSEVMTIDSSTGRWSAWKLRPGERDTAAGPAKADTLIRYGFGDQNARINRGIGFGDFNGDGRTDVIVTDPEAAQMIVFLQKASGGLDLGSTFPGLLGVEQVSCSDFDRDGSDDVVVLSAKEGAVAISKYVDGRLTFPQPIRLADGDGDEPTALAIDASDGKFVALLKPEDYRKEGYDLALFAKSLTGWTREPITDGLKLTGEPDRMFARDLNGDDRLDFLFFPGRGRAAETFLTEADGQLSKIDESAGLGLGATTPGGISFGEIGDRPAVLAARENFARSLTLSDQSRWRVVDQYNAGESNARIVGATSIDLDADGEREVVLIDSGVNKLRVLRREGSLFRPWREIETGRLNYVSCHVADLDSDRRDDLVLFGRGRIAVLYSGQSTPMLDQLAVFETKVEQTFLLDSVAGDLNHDGFADVVLLDGRSHVVELLDYDPETGPRSALHWQLYQEKSFRNETGFELEPRETLIADVTGDGRNDLILLIHDRVLIYPQDTVDENEETDSAP
ncbi:FG-GAP repeat domain-containing protein [Stratiformator vulcanicus]|uniref:FG-GAP repeat protein n=1 Tax=Stratiformator vulcanicus TaxID=2527980 RepID=A0A517QX26_9PLAN|nr:VCBS repeat-containing protein [Stratiformator vulcanicus]QDT36128.1 FG-GAP repeat protein [Stratiformator vulcanicus]